MISNYFYCNITLFFIFKVDKQLVVCVTNTIIIKTSLDH